MIVAAETRRHLATPNQKTAMGDEVRSAGLALSSTPTGMHERSCAVVGIRLSPHTSLIPTESHNTGRPSEYGGQS